MRIFSQTYFSRVLAKVSHDKKLLICVVSKITLSPSFSMSDKIRMLRTDELLN